jgi:uncharacterized protein
LLSQHPGLACEQIHVTRSPLDVAADWPGYFPAGPAIVRLLIDAGANPNADTGRDRPETPLHWAASSDDTDVADTPRRPAPDRRAPARQRSRPQRNPGYSNQTPAEVAGGHGSQRQNLITWLHDRKQAT